MFYLLWSLACRNDGSTREETGVETTGCDDVPLLTSPADPSQRGPWPVGARTVRIGRLTVEVWYPAAPSAGGSGERVAYDLREALPESQQEIIPDADAPDHVCDCERDLPLDEAHGPYPAIVFVHGTAAFRSQSLALMTSPN